MSSHRAHIAPAAATLGLLLGGCGITDPYHHPAAPATTNTPASPAASWAPPSSVQNPGEPPAPPPPSPANQTPTGLQRTPQAALARFAQLYINWSWRTLAADQRQLAAISVGAARLSEQQAAAAAASDTTLRQARVFNTGRVVSIAPSRTATGQWVIVTREQTGGNSQYDGLQASYHLTLAELTRLPGGWVVSKWSPQI